MMSFKMGALDNDEDLIRSAFRVLDKRGTGSVTESEFRFLMTNIGDKISHDEVRIPFRSRVRYHGSRIQLFLYRVRFYGNPINDQLRWDCDYYC